MGEGRQLDRSARQKRSEERLEILTPLIKSALTAMAVTFGKELEEPTFKSWARALDDLSREQIIEGFRRMEKSFIPTAACPFPVPAHLRAHVDEARANAVNLTADSAWEKSMEWVRRYWRPDCRNMTRPELSQLLWRSLCAAGGADWVSECPLEELAWAKKRFIEAYLGLNKLAADQHFISNGEAKRIVSELLPKGLTDHVLKSL